MVRAGVLLPYFFLRFHTNYQWIYKSYIMNEAWLCPSTLLYKKYIMQSTIGRKSEPHKTRDQPSVKPILEERMIRNKQINESIQHQRVSTHSKRLRRLTALKNVHLSTFSCVKMMKIKKVCYSLHMRCRKIIIAPQNPFSSAVVTK